MGLNTVSNEKNVKKWIISNSNQINQKKKKKNTTKQTNNNNKPPSFSFVGSVCQLHSAI